MSRFKDVDKKVDTPASSPKRTEGVMSVSMSFEGFLIESSRKKNKYTENWVESEIKKSSQYFNKEIYSED